MRINSRRLIGLPVLTKSGQDLGKVGSIDIDTENGRLTTIRVKTRGLLQGLLDAELFVDWSQVISIDEDAVVVGDASVSVDVRALAARSAPSVGASGAMLAKADVEENWGGGRNER